MTIENGFLDWKGSQVHYHRFGTGPRLLFALHGYGDHAGLFDPLLPALHNSHTTYAIDLPFHGKTQWNGPRFLQADIHGILLQLALENGQKRFDLMGYSFGGRIVQSLLWSCGPQVERMFLIAPDGLQTQGMSLATNTPYFLRALLGRLLQRQPDFVVSLIDRLYQWKLISRFVRDFCKLHLRTEKRRNRAMASWLSLHDFQFHPKELKKLLRQLDIPLHLYFGKRDKIVSSSGGEWLAKDLPNAQLHMLEGGHLLVGKELQGLLAQQLS
ncbi:MAG: alpha/beta hydrolase [Bacteroidota bacterium]